MTIKSKKYNFFRSTLLIICVLSSVNASAEMTLHQIQVNEPNMKKATALSAHIAKQLTLEISQLTDSNGLVYFAAKVPKIELSGYLAHLKGLLGEEKYALYRQHQAKRDHHAFHVTLVNPYEYKVIDKEKLNINEKIQVTLHGLGKASKDDASAYFVVASSADGQAIRETLLLKKKDFHITLGFYPNDVYGVSKSTDTLIEK